MVKTIQLSEETAKKIYPNAAPEMKLVLEENFGKQLFFTDPKDYIKTIADAEKATGDKLRIHQDDTPDEIAYKELKLLVKALNNDPDFPNWNNSNQRKYSVYVDLSGSRLSYNDCVRTDSLTSVGSRLVLKNWEHARYLVDQFPETMKHFYSK